MPGDVAAASPRAVSPAPSVDLLGPGALLVALDHLGDQLLDVGVAAGLDVAGVVGGAVVGHRALLGELVELGAGELDGHPGVLGGGGLADLGARDLHAEHLHVAAATQLELEDELQLGERRDLRLEALYCRRDQLLCGGHPGRVWGDAPQPTETTAAPASAA